MRPTPSAARPPAVVAATLLAAAACGGEPAGPVGPEPSLSLEAATQEVRVSPGGVALLPVSVEREGGFQGPVTVLARSTPTGVSVEPSVIPEGVASATLRIRADGAAPEGTGAATLEALGSGVGTPGAATVQVTVDAGDGEATGGFALRLEPSVLSIRQGQSGSVRVVVTRTPPFAGPVRLHVTGVPKDVNAQVAPAAVHGEEATLQVDVGADAALGDASLSVVGTAEGVDDRSVQLVLTTFGS